MRPIIVHCHIFKNAGTSVIEAFRRNFGDRVVELEPEDADAYLSPATIEAHLQGHPDTVMVSSHRVRLPLPAQLAGRPVVPLVFLRDPIARLGSVYRFEKRKGREGAFATLARGTSLGGFLRTLLGCGLTQIVSNVQTQLCGGAPAEDLAKGALFGLVEHYTASMALIETRVREWYPACDLAGVSENVTHDPTDTGGAIRRTLQQIGSDLFFALRTLNDKDISLYERLARELAQARESAEAVSRIEDFARRQGSTADAAPCACPSLVEAGRIFGATPPTAASAPGNIAQKFEWHIDAGTENDVPLRVLAVRVIGPGGDAPLLEPGAPIRFEMQVAWQRACRHPVVGFTVRDRWGRVVWCMNTLWTDRRIAPIDTPHTATYSFACQLPPLIGGLYTLDADTADGTADDIRMLVSARAAAAFGIAAQVTPLPGGVVFVRDITFHPSAD